jgi:hypothetical protein
MIAAFVDGPVVVGHGRAFLDKATVIIDELFKPIEESVHHTIN